MKHGDVAVVGSGHSAYGAIQALYDAGIKKITVFDIGLNKIVNSGNYYQNPDARNNYIYGLNDINYPGELDSKRICSSHSFGGFGNVYTGSMMLPRLEDLRDWPKTSLPTNADYLNVARNFSVLSEDDDLRHWPDLSHINEKRANTNFGEDKQHFLGFSRIGYQKSDDNQKLTPFNPKFFLNKLIKKGAIEYFGGTYVRSVLKMPNGLALHAIIKGKEEVFGTYDAIFIGAGCVNSTRIVHESLMPSKTKTYFINNVGGFSQAFFGKGPAKSLGLETRRQAMLPEFFLETFSETFDSKWCHTQISMANQRLLSLVLPRLVSKVTGWLINPVSNIYVAHTTVPSSLTKQSKLIIHASTDSLSTKKFSKVKVVEPNQQYPNDFYLHIKSLVSKLNRDLNLRYLIGSKLIGKQLLKRMGSWHFGGTIPIKTEPGQDITCRPCGEIRGLPGTYLVDSSSFPSIPATTVSLLSMAHAYHIANRWAEKTRRSSKNGNR